MFKSYFLTALRNLIKNPVFSAINILGLSLGLACCITMLIFLTYQLSFDTQFKDYDRTYLLQTTMQYKSSDRYTFKTVNLNKFELICNNLSNIETSASINTGEVTIQQTTDFTETAHYTQSAFFQIFDFPFIEGNPTTALSAPNTAVITTSFAKKYFGTEPAFGKTLQLSDRIITITGIIEKIPANTHLKSRSVKLLLSSDSKPLITTQNGRKPRAPYVAAYLKLKTNTIPVKINQQITYLLSSSKNVSGKKNTKSSNGKLKQRKVPSQEISALPIQNSHLENNDTGIESVLYGSNFFQSWLFIYVAGGLAISALMISCLNFINLTTAKFTQRNREIGLRKVLGASRRHIFAQFICEALALTVIAVVVAIGIVQLGLPWFGQLVETDLSAINYTTPFFLLSIIILIISTTIFSGFYPAMMLSRVNPVSALSSSVASSTRNRLRKILTICQFSFSILLVTICLTFYFQVKHLQNLDMGFQLKNTALIAMINSRNYDDNSRDAIRNELLKHPSIHSTSTHPFGGYNKAIEYNLSGSNDDPIALTHIQADKDFLNHYEIKIIAGVPFSYGVSSQVTSIPRDNTPQRNGAVILTAMGMEKLGFNSPQHVVGKKLQVIDSDIELEIIGVTNAFPKILDNKDIPLSRLGGDFIALTDDSSFWLSIRIKKGQLNIGKEYIQYTVDNFPSTKGYAPDFPQKELDNMFRIMSQALSSVALFALIAIIIAMLGLYAMSSFVVERRTREIGIRKVMGSSVIRLVGLLLWDFSKPVLIALAVATPLAYLGANQVIQHITARIPLELITFGLVPLLIIAIALITVSSHTIKAANTDPVVALHHK